VARGPEEGSGIAAEPLFVTDLVLASVLAIIGGLLRRRAGRHQAQSMAQQCEGRRRPLVLCVTTAVFAWLAVAVLLLATRGWQLVGHRFLLGLPAVMLPPVRLSTVVAHTSAMGA
jgi:MFS family permease